MDRNEIPGTIEVDEKGLLQLLIRHLKDIPNTFLEIDYISQFPSYAVILPEVNFSPRQVIEHMITKHKIAKLEIKTRTDLLLTVIYNYPVFSSVYQFQFTNNMSLTEDILIICYLFHLLKTREYFAVKAIQDLYYMMKHKYDIQDDCMNYEDQKAITAFKITYSFPSIFFLWFGLDPNLNISQNYFHFMYTTFPDLNVKPLYWNPMIASIIPRFKNSKFVPIALLTAISVKSNEQVVKNPKEPNDTELSLNAIYQRILAFNSSEAFPEILKFNLCQMWGIVYKNEQGIYKYSDDFTKYRQEAIEIISELKSQDPDLQTILSKIELEI